MFVFQDLLLLQKLFLIVYNNLLMLYFDQAKQLYDYNLIDDFNTY